MEIHTRDMEDVIESYATMILPSDYGSVRIFAKLALTLGILTILVVCCYRAAGKLKVFLVAAFLATGELSFFLAYNVCWLGNHLYSVWVWCLEKGYIASVDIFYGLFWRNRSAACRRIWRRWSVSIPGYGG